MFISNMFTVWNNTGLVNTAIKMNVSDSGHAAGSKLLDLQVNSTSKFSVDPSGNVSALGNIAAPNMLTYDAVTAIVNPLANTAANTAITSLINGAPTGLRTLGDIATSLGSDPAFAANNTLTLADTLKRNVENQVLTGGARVTSKSLGTITSGTLTLDTGGRPVQHYTNGGAHSLNPGTNGGSIQVDITNNATAGAINTAAYTKVAGAFDTTNAHSFRCWSSVGNAGSMLVIQPLF